MEVLQPAQRAYLQKDLRIDTWADVEPCFSELQDRPFLSLQDLEQWLRDLSELEAALGEEGAWRYIRMSLDTRDEAVTQRFQEFVTTIQPEAEKRADALNRKLMDSPWANELNGDGHSVYLRGIREQLRIYREANVQLLAELRTEAQQYAAITGAMNVEWKGETITLPKAAALLESPDREERKAVWRKINDRRAHDRAKLDDLFDGLVQKRNTVAAQAGFSDFRDYMYSALGRFDHKPSDAFAFHDAVARSVVPVVEALELGRRKTLCVDRLRPWDLSVDTSNKPPLKPFEKAEQLSDLAIEVFSKLHPYFADCLRTMRNKGLLDLASREGKAPGGYNYPLYETGAPFIFMNAVGTHDDLITMVHEGGHAVHSFLTQPLVLTGFKNFPSEVAELASMSMELLTMDHWHLIYRDPEELRRAKRDHLERVIGILPWVATVDAFQHWIYEHPRHTRQQRDAAWLDIHKRFSGKVTDWSGYGEQRAMLWQKQLHIFEVPFYYIEYGIAQLGAIGVWRNYKQNPVQAVEQYMNALKLGYTKPLPEIYAAAGVRFDLGADNVRGLIAFVREELEKL
ncbi:MAG: M3 family oligoendopeptidase [Flavobacteriales bacterium]